MPFDTAEEFSGDVTALLRRAAVGDHAAADALMRTVERELRKLASIHMRRERHNHTLQTTAVVNEAMIRLLGSEHKDWNDRRHFYALASQVMRRVLVDYARSKKALMRNALAVSLECADEAATGSVSVDALDVHLALEEFVKIAPRQTQLVELRFFGGLSLEEAAEVLQISPRSADKDWALARAWLHRRLEPHDRPRA